MVPASRIEIDDFAVGKQVKDTDAVYFTGWFPIADRLVQPAFHEAIAAKLKGGLKASGSGEVVQLAILDAGLSMDMKASDSIAFVGLATVFRERPYQCNLVVNIKTSRGSARQAFEHIQIANRAFGDLEDKSAFVSKCQDALVQKVADFLAKTV